MKHSFRNPLGLTFGAVCRTERKLQDISAEQFAQKLGIKPSFYKLVENGTNYLHTNKSPSVVQALNGEMNLDGVSKMLLAISHSEATARSLASKEGAQTAQSYMDGFLKSIEQLSKLDPNKFGPLLTPYQLPSICGALASASAKEAKEILRKHGLIAQAQAFLKNYDEFGQHDSGLQSNALISKLESVPSMYLDIFSDLANRLSNLPARVGFEEMWGWEKENQHLFKEWWCLQDRIDKVVNEANLERYHYNHLWEKNFKRAQILFIEHGPIDKIKKDFRCIMKNMLNRSAQGACAKELRISHAHQKLKLFDKSMNKITLTTLPPSPSKQHILICEEILPKPFSAFWAFKLIDDSLVGFYAKVTDKNNPVQNMLTEGTSLNHKQTSQKLRLLIQLLNEVTDP